MRAALVDHVITHPGKKYRVALVDMRADPPDRGGAAVHLDFTAAPVDRDADPVSFHLNVSRGNFERPYVLDVIDGTVCFTA